MNDRASTSTDVGSRPQGSNRLPGQRAIETMLIVALVIDVAYWAIWFSNRAWLASDHREAYYEFENAFPLADFWLAVACLLALVTLRRRSELALFWLVAGGGAGLYLGCMDLLYDVEHGIFAKGGGGATEAVIVLLTFGFSITLLTWAWRHRQQLLAPTR